MEVIFNTKRLESNYREAAKATKQWGGSVARKYITRISELYALVNFREAYKLKSLKLHPLKASRKGEMSINLTGRWRLIVLKGANDQQVIIKEVSNHYGN